jgi:hypothetical protein
MSDFCNVTKPIAKRWYKCTDCHCLIASGEQHYKATGVIERQFVWYRFCKPCGDKANWPNDPAPANHASVCMGCAEPLETEPADELLGLCEACAEGVGRAMDAQEGRRD